MEAVEADPSISPSPTEDDRIDFGEAGGSDRRDSAYRDGGHFDGGSRIDRDPTYGDSKGGADDGAASAASRPEVAEAAAAASHRVTRGFFASFTEFKLQVNSPLCQCICQSLKSFMKSFILSNFKTSKHLEKSCLLISPII